MSIFDARIPIEDFDAHQDKIALMLKSLTVKTKDSGLGKKKQTLLRAVYYRPLYCGEWTGKSAN